MPSRYLYASRGGPFATFILIGGVAWAVLVVVILFRPAGDRETLTLVSAIYPVAYLALSWMVAGRSRNRSLHSGYRGTV